LKRRWYVRFRRATANHQSKPFAKFKDDGMFGNSSTIYRRLTIPCCLLIAVVGCGKQVKGPKNRASASGNVTFNGQSLPAGVLVFHSTERSDVTPIPIYGGAYTTDRAPIGKNQVTVETNSIQFGNPAAFVPIPAKYNDSSTSGLTAEIKPGDNENVDFALQK
jgi:hypothetical protein